MRIALVAMSGSPLYPPTAGEAAATARLDGLARALATLGHRVTVYARADAARLPAHAILAPGVTVEQLPAGPAAPVADAALGPHVSAFADALARSWRRSRPDVAHAHGWAAGLAALTAAGAHDVPVALTLQALAATGSRYLGTSADGDPRPRIEPSLARHMAAVLASSEAELADLARLGVPRRRLTLVPAGVDIAVFSPDGRAARRGARPRLLTADHLTAPGDGATMLGALAAVPGAELVAVTSDPSADVARAAAAYGVADRVRVTGASPGARLPALLRSADLVVSTAPYDPAGVTAIRALACGTPVVSCAVAGGCADVVIDQTTGVIVPPERPVTLARSLRRLLDDPVRIEAYGIAGVDRARSRYGWDRIARETLAVYRGCLTHAPSAPAAAEVSQATPLASQQARLTRV